MAGAVAYGPCSWGTSKPIEVTSLLRCRIDQRHSVYQRMRTSWPEATYDIFDVCTSM